jgi:hypothetical protein
MTMKFLSGASPFGAFAYLPGDLRIMAWKELLQERRPSGGFHLRKRCHGILATSRQLNQEVQRELYSDRIITFDICSNLDEAQTNPLTGEAVVAMTAGFILPNHSIDG